MQFLQPAWPAPNETKRSTYSIDHEDVFKFSCRVCRRRFSGGGFRDDRSRVAAPIQRYSALRPDGALMTYKIVRIYAPHLSKSSRVIKRGLTLEEAQEHCKRPETRRDGEWFDGYDAE